MFMAESYREAVQEAARQHKFLMVYLHSPLHQDTPDFCRYVCTTCIVLESKDVCRLGSSGVFLDFGRILLSGGE